MPDRVAGHEPDPAAALLRALPRICRPALEPREAWRFVATLSARTAELVPHDSLSLLWLAVDRRSYRVLAESVARVLLAPDGRSERADLRHSGLRRAFAGEAISIADGMAEPGPGEFERRQIERGQRSWAAVPLKRDDATCGVLVATSATPGRFTREHLDLLAAIADVIVPFVESALPLTQLGEWERRRQCFLAMNNLLAHSLDLRKNFDGIVDTVRPIFDFDIMGVELMSPSGRTSERIVEVGGAGLLPRIRNIDDFSVSQQLLSGQPVLVHDTHTECDPARPGDRILLDAGIRTFILVPLLFPLTMAEQSRGVIYLAKRRPFWFEPLDVDTLRGLAVPVTLAIHHQRQIEQDRRIAAAEGRAEELQQRLEALKSELGSRYGFERILGRSSALREILGRATKVAPTDTTVLITGESGTGKELVAHAIHLASARADGPFMALNCAALPETLLESELFGHEKGAFTGAQKRKPGRFELAAGGTLFLDEVGELAASIQAKLLRVLQEREFQTVGGTETLRADVRLIAATNRDLGAESARGRFREDLLYRLNVFQLHLPPLRERGHDVLLLAEHFVRHLEASMGKSVPGISQEARRALLDYPWPGNIRELQNAIERAMILSDGGLIQAGQLGLDPQKIAAGKRLTERQSGQAETSDGDALVAGKRLPDWERRLVVEALQKASGNKSRAAELLGVTRSQLYTRMKRFGL